MRRFIELYRPNKMMIDVYDRFGNILSHRCFNGIRSFDVKRIEDWAPYTTPHHIESMLRALRLTIKTGHPQCWLYRIRMPETNDWYKRHARLVRNSDNTVTAYIRDVEYDGVGQLDSTGKILRFCNIADVKIDENPTGYKLYEYPNIDTEQRRLMWRIAAPGNGNIINYSSRHGGKKHKRTVIFYPARRNVMNFEMRERTG